MKYSIYSLLCTLTICICVEKSLAHEVYNLTASDQKNITWAAFGFDPGFLIDIGYARGIEIPGLNRILDVTVDFSSPIFTFDFKHYKIDAGTRIPFFTSNWNIINRFGIAGKGTDNEIYSSHLLSIKEGLVSGYFSEMWFCAIEATFEKYLLSKVKHTTYYKTIYPGVKSGWYKSTGGKWCFALQAGYTIKNIVEPTIRIGTYWHEQFSAPIMTMPVFADISLNVRF